MRLTGDPVIEIDGARIDQRDISALRGIEQHGSMHKAAGELGRSYSRIQQRITELEETLGPLVSRTRGGEGGGGSTLTPTAYDIIARFDRLQAEFTGLARAEESVFSGRVLDRAGMLGTIETAAGRVRGIVPADCEQVQIGIRSDAVALTTPAETPEPTGTSVRNRFEGTVTGIETEAGLARVAIDVGADTPLHALLTEDSLDKLDLATGSPVVASFKATATRAIQVPDTEDGA